MPGVREQRKAIVFTGSPGAGRSSLRRKLPQSERGTTWSLRRQSLAGTTYEASIKPDATREAESTEAHFSPPALPTLIRNESSYLTKGLLAEAI